MGEQSELGKAKKGVLLERIRSNFGFELIFLTKCCFQNWFWPIFKITNWKLPWNLSHEDLLQDSNLPPLNKCRDVASLCHLYKIFSNLCSSLNPLWPHPKPDLRNLNSCAVSFHSTGCPYPNGPFIHTPHSGTPFLRSSSVPLPCSHSNLLSRPTSFSFSFHFSCLVYLLILFILISLEYCC